MRQQLFECQKQNIIRLHSKIPTITLDTPPGSCTSIFYYALFKTSAPTRQNSAQLSSTPITLSARIDRKFRARAMPPDETLLTLYTRMQQKKLASALHTKTLSIPSRAQSLLSLPFNLRVARGTRKSRGGINILV